MRSKFFGILVSVMLLMLTFSAAAAAGPTVGQLENAGWFCFDPDGPGPFGMHCIKPQLNPAGEPASVPVMVFDAVTGEFAGTEVLIRADVYENGGQLCPQEGLGSYEPVLGGAYVACHHFSE